MAEVNKLTIPPALYDYVLFYECATKDWKPGAKKSTITGNGSLMNLINWNSTYSLDHDDAGGKTLFGVTENVWKDYVKNHPNKGYSQDINKMGQKGWLDIMDYYWSDYSHADKCANYACAFTIFQMSWGGFSSTNKDNLLMKLKQNADIKDYNFITKGSTYKKIADATHAYTDPMIAYDYMRKAKSTYLYNISTPDRTNKKYRVGWLNRNVLPFTPYGLYIPTNFGGKDVKLKYESPLSEWYSTSTRLIQEGKNGYIKIMDWGVSPESIEKVIYNPYDYTSPSYSSGGGSMSSGLYGGYGNISLGSYSSTDGKIITQPKNKEDVLRTLIGNSLSPNSITTCGELITTDKKKGVKPKSEN